MLNTDTERKFINLNKEICFRPKAAGLKIIQGRNDVRKLDEEYYATSICVFMELFGGYRMGADYNKYIRFDVYFNDTEFSTAEELEKARETQMHMEEETDILEKLVTDVVNEIKDSITIDENNRVISSGKMVSMLCAMDKRVVITYNSSSNEVTVGVNVIQYYVHKVMQEQKDILPVTDSDVLSYILLNVARNNQLVYEYKMEKSKTQENTEE